LRMEAAWSFETLVLYHINIRYHNTLENDLNTLYNSTFTFLGIAL